MTAVLHILATYVLPFVVVLSVVVFVHEMGHYLIARWNGVRVDVFSIGFGPELFGWNARNGTRWKVSALPLGGYIKMFGDAGAASTPEAGIAEMPPEERAVSFHHKRLGQRAAIVFGGPLANFLLAVVVFAVLFATVGRPMATPEVSEVLPDGAAAKAGMQAGDLILSIDGEPIDQFIDVQRIVRESAGVPLHFVVRRQGREITLTITPRAVEREDRFGNRQRYGLIGVTRTGVTLERLDPLSASWQAVDETLTVSASILGAIGQIVTGRRSVEDLGGPIRIAQISGQMAKDGILTVIRFTAILSINLGLINLFPIPALDGGHLLFYFFEALRGRPLSERAQEYGFRIGFALVLALMVFAFWNDLVQLRFVDYLRGLFS